MKKTIRIIAVVLVVLIALLLTAPYMFKGKIMGAVKTEINKSVDARVEFGNVGLSLFRSFPDLALSLKDLNVIGKKEFASDTLVAFRAFDVSIDLGSLISGDNIRVNTITLNRPQVYARVLPNGKANWDIVPEGEAPEEPETDTVSGGTPNIQFQLEEFAIRNGRIAYLDEAAKMMAGIKGFDYTLSGDFSAKKATLKQMLSAEAVTFLYDEVRYLNKAAVNFDAAIDADLENYKFTFKNNTFGLNNLKLNFDGWLSMPKEAINMDIRFNTPSSRFKDLLSLVPQTYMKDFEALETSGNFQLNGVVKGAYKDGNIPGFTVKLNVDKGTVSYPDLPEAVKAIKIAATVKNPGGTGMENRVNVSEFHAEMADNPLDGTLKIHTTKEDVDMSGNMQGKIDLSRVQEFVDLGDMEIGGLVNADMDFAAKLSDIENENYKNISADGKLTMNEVTYKGPELPHPFNISESTMQFSPREVSLLSFDARTGNSDVSLNGSLSNYIPYLFEDETVKGELNVSASKLKAGDFLVESQESEKEEEPKDTTRMTAVKVPENINFMLNARIGEILYDKIKVRQFRGKIRVKDGVARLQNTQMAMLGGNLKLRGTYNTRQIKHPAIDLGLDINHFAIAKTYNTFNTFKKLAPIAKYLNGKFSTSLQIAGKLNRYLKPDLSTYDGEGTLEANAVQVEEAPLFNGIAKTTGMQRFKNPEMKNVYASFEIVDGTIFFDSRPIKLGDHEFTVAGSQSLDKSMDYTVQTQVPTSALGSNANKLMTNLAAQVGLDVSDKKQIGLNINITGKTNDPKFSLSLAESDKSAKETVKDKVADKLKEEKQKAEEKAREKVDSLKEKAQKESKKKADSLKKKARKKGKKKADSLKKKAKEKLKELW